MEFHPGTPFSISFSVNTFGDSSGGFSITVGIREDQEQQVTIPPQEGILFHGSHTRWFTLNLQPIHSELDQVLKILFNESLERSSSFNKLETFLDATQITNIKNSSNLLSNVEKGLFSSFSKIMEKVKEPSEIASEMRNCLMGVRGEEKRLQAQILIGEMGRDLPMLLSNYPEITPEIILQKVFEPSKEETWEGCPEGLVTSLRQAIDFLNEENLQKTPFYKELLSFQNKWGLSSKTILLCLKGEIGENFKEMQENKTLARGLIVHLGLANVLPLDLLKPEEVLKDVFSLKKENEMPVPFFDNSYETIRRANTTFNADVFPTYLVSKKLLALKIMPEASKSNSVKAFLLGQAGEKKKSCADELIESLGLSRLIQELMASKKEFLHHSPIQLGESSLIAMQKTPPRIQNTPPRE